MKNNIQKAIEKIRLENITPEPRWKFVLSVYWRWSVFAAVVLLGAVALSIMLANITGLDWDIYTFARQNHLLYILSLFPYLWGGILCMLCVLSFVGMRKTEAGYRYSPRVIIAIAMGGIIFLGIIFSWFQFGSISNSFLESHAPYYKQHAVVTRESQWTRPDDGFLSGNIISTAGDTLVIEDIHKKQWIIVIDDMTRIKPMASLEVGSRIKIIGTAHDTVFAADEIRPWQGKGMMKGNNR